ncbi:hypothetical protein C8R43DRAFT_946374 [Mycena crocata]|nr:hypothetical protein C8R43DRAFT_946374 [Mycena crocata]
MPSSPSSLFTPPPEDEDSDEEDQLVDDVEIADSYCAPTPSADLSILRAPRIVSYNRTESSASLVHVPRNVPLRSRMMSNGFLSNPTAQEFKDGEEGCYSQRRGVSRSRLLLNALQESRAKPSQPRQFHQPDAPDGEEHSQGLVFEIVGDFIAELFNFRGKRQRAVEDDRVGRAAKITKTSTMHPPPSLVEEHPLPRGAVPPSSAEDMEPHVPIATPLPSGSAPPSQLPHSSSIYETGFKSMRQVRTLAAYSKADLKETIDDLFKLPEGGMTKLERVL